MIFLPVVERELRVAARKRGTFWSRIAAAIVTLIFGAGILILVQVVGNTFTTPAIGKFLFTGLTWLSLATALFAGVFFTSDCLSEEKREGTLGFLFLTDLRGYDVVLGKLLATSLRGFYTFFAVLPVLAITLLMGGVTGQEFWRVCVALLSALFFSLAVGMFISTFSREPQKALGGTLFSLVVLSALGPSADALMKPMRPIFSLSSPVYLFLNAGWAGQTYFGKALLVNQIIAFVLLGFSCVMLPRTWQVKATKAALIGETWTRWWRYGSDARRLRLRRKLIDVNPVLWLASRERWQATALWIITVLTSGVVVATIVVDGVSFAWSYLSGALTLALYLAVAADSGRFFVLAQRTGLVELLLATPLTVHDIVRGHWRGLLRIYLVPLIVCLAVQFAGTAISQQKTYRQMAAITATTTVVSNNTVVVVTNTVSGPAATKASLISERWLARLMPFFSAALNTVTTLANLLALCWFGMWMGMTSKNSNLATLKTFVFVQVVPWFAIAFASTLLAAMMMVPGFLVGITGNSSQWFLWYPFLTAAMTTLLCVAKDTVFILLSRRKLFSDFRIHATRTVLPIHTSRPPKLVPPPQPLNA